MIKKLLIVAILIGLPSTVLSQNTTWLYPQPIPCVPYRLALPILQDVQEELLFTTTSVQALIDNFGETRTIPYKMLFFVNQTTGTYTAIQLYENGSSCLLSAGMQFEPYIK